VASLDVLSNGRFLFGIGGGWNAEEMADHGTDFKKRWRILRERVLAMKQIWTHDEAEFHGDHVNFDKIKALGWTPRQGEPDDAATARATLVGTLGAVSRDAEVLSKARELALAELEKPGSVQPGLVNVVVDLAASDGDQALYEKYLERSRAAKDPEEKYRYLNALTSFRDPALVRRTMNLILGPDVRSQDAKVLIAQLLGNTDTQHLGWELLQARWDDVQKKTGEFVGNTVIVSGLGAFCDARTVDEVKQFFSAHTVPDAERTLQQTIERIASCAALSAAQSDKLAAWLMTR